MCALRFRYYQVLKLYIFCLQNKLYLLIADENKIRQVDEIITYKHYYQEKKTIYSFIWDKSRKYKREYERVILCPYHKKREVMFMSNITNNQFCHFGRYNSSNNIIHLVWGGVEHPKKMLLDISVDAWD